MHARCSRILTLAALVALGIAALPAAADVAPKAPTPGRTIDLVICLDVSNSMDGLINSAKARLWDIVNELAKVQPTPNLRVALYSYGHTGYNPQAGWVRKELDFTTDLDLVYQKLTALTTRGGTEYVGRVCQAALDEQKWTEDKSALKIIFVCGNEPATQDPQVNLKELARKAVTRDIYINTIYCGNPNNAEALGWKELADLAEGRYACIDQNRGTVAITTPMDKELIELGNKLNTTYLAYGSLGRERRANQLAQDINARQAGVQAEAGRAAAKGGGLYKNADWDLVDKLKDDPTFDIKTIPEADLPEELKKLKPEEREQYVRDMLAKRLAIQKQINELNARRQSYINEQLKKTATDGEKALDEAIRTTLREQAKKKGITIPD
jgi:hypothetical protein